MAERFGRWPSTFRGKVTLSLSPSTLSLSIPEGEDVAGFVMVEQVKSIDFRSRKARRIGQAPVTVLEEALSLLDACIY